MPGLQGRPGWPGLLCVHPKSLSHPPSASSSNPNIIFLITPGGQNRSDTSGRFTRQKAEKPEERRLQETRGRSWEASREWGPKVWDKRGEGDDGIHSAPTLCHTLLPTPDPQASLHPYNGISVPVLHVQLKGQRLKGQPRPMPARPRETGQDLAPSLQGREGRKHRRQACRKSKVTQMLILI